MGREQTEASRAIQKAVSESMRVYGAILEWDLEDALKLAVRSRTDQEVRRKNWHGETIWMIDHRTALSFLLKAHRMRRDAARRGH